MIELWSLELKEKKLTNSAFQVNADDKQSYFRAKLFFPRTDEAVNFVSDKMTGFTFFFYSAQTPERLWGKLRLVSESDWTRSREAFLNKTMKFNWVTTNTFFDCQHRQQQKNWEHQSAADLPMGGSRTKEGSRRASSFLLVRAKHSHALSPRRCIPLSHLHTHTRTFFYIHLAASLSLSHTFFTSQQQHHHQQRQRQRLELVDFFSQSVFSAPIVDRLFP